ncbi:MAG TPA: AAA family ATPase [Mycobacteriales bacterium]|nr:AAA family ATPase [Mycobacteriales bacterium]
MAACVACGEPLGDGARFCAACGHAVQVGAPHEERKVISILFVDLVGSTAAADGKDPEVVRDVLRSYHQRVKEELEPYGAVVEKFIGDAVMAVFGAPHAHSDDAERAVRAGLRALDAVSSLTTPTGTALAARAAVATGEAVVMVDANAGAGEALAMGDVVNIAARLQSAAPENRLLVDDTTMRATRRTISYREADPVVAKGKADPLPAWLADAVSSESVAPVGRVPLVGRDAELSQLLATWERVAQQGRPSLVAVIGAAGAGKSRLASEFRDAVDARVVTGRSLPYEQANAYGSFTRQLRQLAGIVEGDDRSVGRAKLDRLVDTTVPEPERAEVRRCVAALLSQAADEPVVSDSTVLFYSIRRLVESVSTDRPTVFVFEDVHWAEAAEYELIRYLAQYVRDVPAMFVLLARPELMETRPDWSSGLLSYSTMPLEPLAGEDARTIVRTIAGAGLLSDVVTRLVERGAGNPLFLEELATAVAESRGSGADDLPANVRSAIASRIDALPADARSLLLTASVVGRSFWVGAVASIAAAEVGGALALLEQRDLIRRQPTSEVPGEVEFRFKHALIRDVCYGTLPKGERARTHAAVATYLEQRVGGDDEFAWLLGHHFEQAGAAAEAIRYLLAASDRAKAVFAPTEAVALLDRAERLALDEPTRTRIRLARGRTLTIFEDYDEGYATLQPLLPLLSGDDLIEALTDYARCCHWTERTDEVIEVAQRAADLARELGRMDAVAPALARLSQGYAMRGREGDLARGIDIGEQALATWSPGIRAEDRAEHEYLLGHQYHWAGDYHRAIELARTARETAVEDPASVEARLRGIGMDGILLATMGDYQEALAKFDDALTLAEEIGRPRRVLMNYSTLAFRELFDLEEARRRSSWVLDGIPKSSFHMPWMNAEADLLHADVLAGDWGAAASRWNDLYPQVAATEAWERWLLGSKLVTFRAEIALHTEEPAVAADWAARALDSILESARIKYEPSARDTLARALAAMGDGERARSEVGAAVASADRLDNPHVRLLTHTHAAATLYRLGDDDAAAAHHRVAEQIAADVAAGLAPDSAAHYLAAVPLPAVDEYR